MRVFVVIYDMILKNIIGKIIIIEFSSDYKIFKFFQKEFLFTIFLKNEEQIVKKKITIIYYYAKLNWNSYKIPVHFRNFFVPSRILKILKIFQNINTRLIKIRRLDYLFLLNLFF